MPKTTRERFEEKTVQGQPPAHAPELGPCRLWTGAKVGIGYGRAWDGKRLQVAHKLAYEWENGPVPDGLFVLHKCDTPSCVRVDHLFTGDHSDNMKDRAAKGRAKHAKGEHNGQSKLTADDVRSIRQRRKAGEGTTSLGRAFNVDPKTIRQIDKREIWSHI